MRIVARLPCCVMDADAACEALLEDRRSGEPPAASSFASSDVDALEANVSGTTSLLCPSPAASTSGGGSSASSNSQAGSGVVSPVEEVTFRSASPSSRPWMNASVTSDSLITCCLCSSSATSD